MRILVVDDEPAVRDALERALRLEGYEVDLAADGSEALALVSKRPPDALILDLMMPRIDGLEVCRRMREAGDRTPVLVLTARDAVSDRVTGLDAGADDYVEAVRARGALGSSAVTPAPQPARIGWSDAPLRRLDTRPQLLRGKAR